MGGRGAYGTLSLIADGLWEKRTAVFSFTWCICQPPVHNSNPNAKATECPMANLKGSKRESHGWGKRMVGKGVGKEREGDERMEAYIWNCQATS